MTAACRVTSWSLLICIAAVPLDRANAIAPPGGKPAAATKALAPPPGCTSGAHTTVSPCGTTVTAYNSASGSTVVFTVSNTSGSSDELNIACSVLSPVSTCSVSNGTVIIGANSSKNITVTYSTAADTGAGRVTLQATSNVDGDAANGKYNVHVIYRSYLNATSAFNDQQFLDACVASCFAATASYSTVPSFTLGTPRNVTLVYRGDRVRPKPIVYADAWVTDSSETVQQYWLQVKVNGATVTFTNGEQTLHFTGSMQTVRLGGQFSITGTGVSPMQLIVTAQYPTHTETVTLNTNLVYVDEYNSQIARGWTLAGIQRLYVQGDGSALITEGNGSATWFASCGSGCYSTPQHDFSKMVYSGGVYTRSYPDSTKVTFSWLGYMSSIRDRFGNTTNLVYDGSNRLVKIADPFRTCTGGVAQGDSLVYGAGGWLGTYGLIKIIGQGAAASCTGGRVTNLTLASDSTIRAIKDPDGDSTRFTYDGSTRLQTIVDRAGVTAATFVYNANSGKLDSLVIPTPSDGSCVDCGSRVAVTFSPWQMKGVPTSATSSTPWTSIIPDSMTARITDPEGHATTFTVNKYGEPLRVTDAVGRKTRIDYQVDNPIFPEAITNPWGAADGYSHSGPFQIYHTTPMGTSISTKYGAYGQVDSVFQDGTLMEVLYLGTNGRADSSRVGSDAAMPRTKYTYDSFGRVTSVKDPLNHVTNYHYDSRFGNVDSVQSPGNSVQVTRFDAYGRDSASRANNQPWVKVLYDTLNRVLRSYDGVNANPTTYSYDKLNVIRIQDPKAYTPSVYKLTYNELGQVARRYDSSDTTKYVRYKYFADGTTARWINRRGDSVSFTYDAVHRPLTQSGSNTTSSSFGYSDFVTSTTQRLVRSNAYAAETAFVSASGWTDSVITRLGGNRFRRFYRANARAQLDSLGITTSTSISFTPRRYYYGAQTHVLDSIKLNGSKTSLARNSEFAVTRTTWPSGVAQSDSFSAKHELYQRQFTDTAINNRLWQGYRFDSLGRVTQNAWKNTSGSGLLVDFFTYDSLGRVSSTLRSATTCPTSDSTYGYSCSPSGVPDLHTYDEAGNALVPSWTYSAQSNRLLSSPYGGYSYDADGNMIGRNRAYTTTRDSLFWSADGLLDSLRSGTVIIRYRYDAIGRLVQKTSNRTSTDSSYFLWDGTQLLAELNGAGTQRVAEYVYYGGTDHPMAMLTGATTTTGTYYFVQDQIGNVIGSVSGSTVPDRYTYDYWGNRSVVSTSGFNRLAWKGLVWEGDSTSMYYMRNRWYDPNIGRFVTEDPIGVQGGVNLYAFAGADHINGIDVSGLGDDFVLVCFNNPAPLPAGPANDTTKAPQARKRDRICVQMSLADLVNFIAGFGDAASFGLAYDLRDRIGGNENVDVSSKAYALGQILGVAAGSALGDELLQLLRSAEGLQAFGVTARFLEYDSGGSGLNFFWGGTRRNRLAFDWHEFKRWGRMNDLPHIDFRTVEGNILKHWPWSW